MDKEVIISRLNELINEEVLLRGDKINMEGFLYGWRPMEMWIIQNPLGNYKLELEEISFVAGNYINLKRE